MNASPMPSDLLERYLSDPVKMDGEVRSVMRIRHDCYYTVSVYPMAGAVRVDTHRSRNVQAQKISKSNP